MSMEYDALLANGTWNLVPQPPGANIITSEWLFKHKFHSDGTLVRHTVRWFIRGFSKPAGVDYDESFIPVVKSTTIHTILSIAASCS